MKYLIPSTFLLLVTFIPISAQLTGPYLGQTPPGTTFVPFAPGIVPEDMYQSVTVSPDGDEIYWAARNGITVTKIENGQWTTPEIVSFSGISEIDFYDDAPVLSPDNTKLFFNSLRPCDPYPSLTWRYWYTERTDSGWADPQPLPDVINSTGGMHWHLSVANSGTIYFGAISGPDIGIYFSRFIDGAYTTPEPLTVINNFGNVICPFIAPDESYIIFNKVETGFAVGHFISFKGNEGQWLPPELLFHLPYRETSFVSRDGKYIFCKELWASAEIIEDMRPNLKEPYMGQEPPGTVPQPFAPDIVGTGLHGCPVFTPDGMEAYWSTISGSITTMMYSKATDSQWTDPAEFDLPAEFSNSDSPHLDSDGSRLYFTSVLPISPGSRIKENIWYMNRVGEGWDIPQPLAPIVNDVDLHWQVSVADNGNLYFSGFGDNGSVDILLSRFIDGQYTQPQILDSNINGPGSLTEVTPFIAPDESFLIFSRHDENAAYQFSDLYISFGKPDDSWTMAEPMAGLNTPMASELCPNFTRDGEYFFFVRDTVHWVSALVIDDYRPGMTCGDANSDELINIGDVVYLVNLVFHDGPLPDPEAAGDVNCDGAVNVGDAVYMGNYIFQKDSSVPCADCP